MFCKNRTDLNENLMMRLILNLRNDVEKNSRKLTRNLERVENVVVVCDWVVLPEFAERQNRGERSRRVPYAEDLDVRVLQQLLRDIQKFISSSLFYLKKK